MAIVLLVRFDNGERRLKISRNPTTISPGVKIAGINLNQKSPHTKQTHATIANKNAATRQANPAMTFIACMFLNLTFTTPFCFPIS
jgi:hypothetical protein